MTVGFTAIRPYGLRSLNSRYLTVNGLSGQRGSRKALFPLQRNHTPDPLLSFRYL